MALYALTKIFNSKLTTFWGYLKERKYDLVCVCVHLNKISQKTK